MKLDLHLSNVQNQRVNSFGMSYIENCKGNRDYDLNSNNEIAKVEQLEIKIGKSMMNSVF